MRTIKCRAWDKEKQRMFNVAGIDFAIMSVIDDKTSWLDFKQGGEIKDIELMQYTGLKDKNGKEAYFDDLVKLKDNDDIWQIVQDDFGIPCFLKNDGSTAIDFKDFFMEYGKHDFEIIGNIYENKDLLK